MTDCAHFIDTGIGKKIVMMLPKACVVLPTYNEAENVQAVIEGVFKQAEKITSHDLYVLVVDDNSPDNTQNVVQNLMKYYEKLYLNTGDKHGLGEAYKRGMKHAQDLLAPDLIFMMDADRQHNPELIPLFITLANYGFSLVIGSRFSPGGDTPNFSLRRKTISLLGNWMIRFLGGIPRIRDCTSGFRCIKVDYLKKCKLKFLSTRGYSFQTSLLFELLRNGVQVIEVPIIFPDRIYGKSKLTLRDQLEFLLNIGKIRFQQSKEFVKFCMVGISGIFVNLGLYIILTRILNIDYKIAAPIAIEVSILTNFTFNYIWTFKRRKSDSHWFTKLTKYHIVAGVAGVANYINFLGLIYILSLHDIIANLVGIAVGTLINYSLNSLWTWRETREKSTSSKNQA